MPNRYVVQRGFTLVELIVVIIIIGIMSAYAASRLQGTSSFSPYAAQAQAVSVIRQVQLARMQSNQNTPFSQLQIENNCLGSTAACGGNTNLSSRVLVGEQNFRFFVDPTPQANSQFIEFDALGRPLPITNSTETSYIFTGTSYTITIEDINNPSEQTRVCINGEGFVDEC
ncbi:MAG: prepilin-type N-terminal cleavage/methylation domain-containing protein [Vibrio sp.]